MHQTTPNITHTVSLYLDPKGQILARPRQVDVLEERNRCLVEALTRALERVRELTQELLEVRR